MKKKDIDEGYIVGDFYIVKSPIKEGWLHIVNIKTSWQIKVMMGANTAFLDKIVLLLAQLLHLFLSLTLLY
jgi:hypothetical protein